MPWIGIHPSLYAWTPPSIIVIHRTRWRFFQFFHPCYVNLFSFRSMWHAKMIAPLDSSFDILHKKDKILLPRLPFIKLFRPVLWLYHSFAVRVFRLSLYLCYSAIFLGTPSLDLRKPGILPLCRWKSCHTRHRILPAWDESFCIPLSLPIASSLFSQFITFFCSYQCDFFQIFQNIWPKGPGILKRHKKGRLPGGYGSIPAALYILSAEPQIDHVLGRKEYVEVIVASWISKRNAKAFTIIIIINISYLKYIYALFDHIIRN